MNRHLIFLISALFFNAFANIFMKYGAKSSSVDGAVSGIKALFLSYVTNIPFISGLFFFGIALLFYQKALEKFNLSIAYPIMTSGGIVLITLWSLLFFGEKLSYLQVTGILFIGAGLWLINSN